MFIFQGKGLHFNAAFPFYWYHHAREGELFLEEAVLRMEVCKENSLLGEGKSKLSI